MSQTYYTILTDIGEAKLANAIALGNALPITHMAVGDGSGTVPVPVPTQTALVNEVRRAPLNSLGPDPQNPNALLAEQVIAEDVGGWWIRELGLYDQDGDLIAVGNCPETYKPVLAEGSGRTQVIRMLIIVSNVDAVELKVDPTIVLATRQFVIDQRGEVEQRMDNDLIEIEENRLAGIELTRDSVGFVNRSTSGLTFNDLSRTISLTGTNFDVYHFGKKISMSGRSVQIDDVSGGRYITLNPVTLQLQDAGELPGFDALLVAYVYWSTELQRFLICGDERHGVQRDTTWHRAQHLNEGMVWRSGAQPIYTVNDPQQVGISLTSPITVADEDLEHTIIHDDESNQPWYQKLEGGAELPILFIGTDGYYSELTPTALPFSHNAQGIRYNEINPLDNTGTLSDVPDGKFVSMFVMASHCQKSPVKLIMGRKLSDSAAEARDESLLAYGLNFPEFVYLYHLVFEKDDAITENPGKVRLAAVYEPARPVSSAATGVTANDHAALSGRTKADQHPVEAITGLKPRLESLESGGAKFTDTQNSNAHYRLVVVNGIVGLEEA